jgi:hypothetical protein
VVAGRVCNSIVRTERVLCPGLSTPRQFAPQAREQRPAATASAEHRRIDRSVVGAVRGGGVVLRGGGQSRTRRSARGQLAKASIGHVRNFGLPVRQARPQESGDDAAGLSRIILVMAEAAVAGRASGDRLSRQRAKNDQRHDRFRGNSCRPPCVIRRASTSGELPVSVPRQRPSMQRPAGRGELDSA